MARRKIYRVVTGIELSIPVLVNRQRVLITFSGENASFSTVNKDIQMRIEGRPDFGKTIVLSDVREVEDVKESKGGGVPLKKEVNPVAPPVIPSEGESNEEAISVFDTDDWQEAKEILRGEPYGVAYQSLATPEKILAKASELGLQFPNLRLE